MYSAEHEAQVKCMYGYEYDLDGLFHSAITDVRSKHLLCAPVYLSIIPFKMDWVCDDAWIGPFTQAMFFVGAAIGALVFGYISDIYGRYPTFVASNVVSNFRIWMRRGKSLRTYGLMAYRSFWPLA